MAIIDYYTLFVDLDPSSVKAAAKAVVRELLGSESDEYATGRWFNGAKVPDGDPFFILWNPNSVSPPTVRFAHYDDAMWIAQDMAQRHGGTFYVLEVKGRARRVAFTSTETF